MQLNQEQIKQIKEYLKAINFNYIDLKHEILDHMITDIENIMQEKQVDFHTVFTIVKIKWNSNFKQRSSLILGHFNLAPKIVIDKTKEIFTPFFIGYFISYYLPMILFRIFNIQLPDSLNLILLVLVIISLTISFYLIVKMASIKYDTVYSFLFNINKFSFFILLMSILILAATFKDISSIAISLSITGIYSSIVSYYLFKQHLTALKKHQLKWS